MSEIKRVRVKFLDSMAGLRDPTPAILAAKYAKLEEALRAEKNGKLPLYKDHEVRARVDAAKAADDAVIPAGFAKDWSFKPGEEASVNAAIAEHWEAAGQVTVLLAARDSRANQGDAK